MWASGKDPFLGAEGMLGKERKKTGNTGPSRGKARGYR
jgi:hypothetical protein